MYNFKANDMKTPQFWVLLEMGMIVIIPTKLLTFCLEMPLTNQTNQTDIGWTRSVSECEPRHDKTNKVAVRPAKTQISLGIRCALNG